MSDLGLLNFGNEELDYDENEIDNLPEEDVTKKNSESEGEISDDGEIKSGKSSLTLAGYEFNANLKHFTYVK